MAEADLKILVVYYSRSGTTRKVAKSLSVSLGCEIEEIVDVDSRSGARSYLRSLMEGMRRRASRILPPNKDPASYDVVVIGTPVWAWSVSSPVRAYLAANRTRLPAVAFFCTLGGGGNDRAFAQMQRLVGKPPLDCCAIFARDVTSNKFGPRVAEFAQSLGRSRLGDQGGPASANRAA